MKSEVRIVNSDVRIRTAVSADADAIARVVNAAFEVERHMRANPKEERTSSADVLVLMQQVTFFVAEQDNCIVGAILVRITGTTGYFGMLSADSKLRGLGVGKALREQAEEFCRQQGCIEMTLTTGEFRTELLPYYQRAGYSIVSIEPGPPEWGFSRAFKVVHMSKKL